jgi:hypothetical protein
MKLITGWIRNVAPTVSFLVFVALQVSVMYFLMKHFGLIQ